MSPELFGLILTKKSVDSLRLGRMMIFSLPADGSLEAAYTCGRNSACLLHDLNDLRMDDVLSLVAIADDHGLSQVFILPRRAVDNTDEDKIAMCNSTVLRKGLSPPVILRVAIGYIADPKGPEDFQKWIDGLFDKVKVINQLSINDN